MRPREQRQKVLIRARMRVGAVWADVCVLNISSRGLMLQCAEAPPRGSYVEVRRGAHVIVARVVWSAERRFGVHTQERLDIDAIIAEPDNSGLPQKAAGSPPIERRAVRRELSPSERHERSRVFARAAEFACVALIGAAAAGLAFEAIGDTLGQPLATASATLGGKQAVSRN